MSLKSWTAGLVSLNVVAGAGAFGLRLGWLLLPLKVVALLSMPSV